MAVASRALHILLVVLSMSKLSTAMIVCDPSAGPQSVTVGPNERVMYTSKNYPMAYPQGSCDVSFYPATLNTKLVLIFEYFRAGNESDTLDFYANITNSAPGSMPKLQIVQTVAGEYWSPDFRYPANINEPSPDFSGIIQTKFTARSNLLAPGFIAHIIGYDMSKPLNECRSDMTVLKAGESYLAVSTGAPFNGIAPATCSWSVKPADANTLLRVVVNFFRLTNGQVAVSTMAQPTVNITGMSDSVQGPQSIFGNIGIVNEIDFKFSKFGHYWEDGIFTYSIVVEAFSAQPSQSSCPSTGMTFDLVDNGANVMEPFYIQTQTDFTRFYANNQHCSWMATVSNPDEYVIVSYIHINQLEDCCDMFMTTTDNGKSWHNMIWNKDYPKQSQLMVKFDSDYMRTELGGKFELRAVPLFDASYANGFPVPLPRNAVEMNIQTPGYEFAIPSGIDLTYTFVSPVGTWVRFRLSNKFAANAIMQYNNFTIYDGATINSPMIGAINNAYLMSESNNPYRAYTNFFSTQRYLTVRWQSGVSSIVDPDAGIQLSLAGVTDRNQVQPNFGDGTSSSSTMSSTSTTTASIRQSSTSTSTSRSMSPSATTMSPASSQSTPSSATSSMPQSAISSGSSSSSSTGMMTTPKMTGSPSTTSMPVTSSAPSIQTNSFSIVFLFFCASAFFVHLL